MPVSNHTPDAQRCLFVANGLAEVGYRAANPIGGRRATWRVSPRPLMLPREDVEWLYKLGRNLQAFNVASNALYLGSVAGQHPRWIAEYLEQGKPKGLVELGRARHVRPAWPTVIRPDIIPTPGGMLITELDAVPGGMGVIARLCELYNALGHELLGDDVTIPGAFDAMVRSVTEGEPRLAIVVSDESAAYRPEMAWLSARLTDRGIDSRTLTPSELSFSDDGVTVRSGSSDVDVNAVYRFFELFDIPNIPNVETLMLRCIQKRVAVVPPFRPVFEEKMWFALFHHPLLANYWRRALGEAYTFLKACFPPTWILDPEAIPPHATIPDLVVAGAAVNSWGHLENIGRSERHYVIKPSGFSERAWGSRGVIVGHDISTGEWNAALARAVGSFAQTPHILQEFRSGRQFEGSFYDGETHSTRTIACRVRLCPYYFVIGDEVRLASVMATMCPLDKKKIHGMPDAIIVPCSVEGTTL